jgi:DNA polymerase I-like protein with 3'-5' exonuclease and polymerase domains
MLAIDTETTGLDLYHGALPFFVTTCKLSESPFCWEWDVDPLTREVSIPNGDREEIQALLDEDDEIILHNAKFDATALAKIGIQIPWDKVYDTLIAAHLLGSNLPHDLTACATIYLGENIIPLEEKLGAICKQARALARRQFPEWKIAKVGIPDMPSVKSPGKKGKSEKDKGWKFDTWLPRAIAQELGPENGYDEEHEWNTALGVYANADSEITVDLFPVMRRIIEERGLWKIYLERLKILPIAMDIEGRGLTVSKVQHKLQVEEYREATAKCRAVCTSIADNFIVDCPECCPPPIDPASAGVDKVEPANPKSKKGKKSSKVISYKDALKQGELFDNDGGVNSGKCRTCSGKKKIPYPLKLPKSGNNDSLKEFVFNKLQAPVLERSKKTGEPSLKKGVIEQQLLILSNRSQGYHFLRNLADMRKRDTALTYLAAYERFWLPLLDPDGNPIPNWWVLHPSLNPTGTDTIRWSSSNPNEQNVSKKEGFNLRACFAPAPGREWWAGDAENIELRIPAYEAGEELMIGLFERPKDPPYYGSNHLLNFSAIYPDIWDKELLEHGLEKVGAVCKKKYESTYYQWCKNGGFAVQYGAVDKADGTGTADRAFHRPGCHAKLKARFARIHGPGGLNERCIRMAERLGYVETIPDKTVDPKRGYPLMCTRTEWGKILPTVPLNYHVQGTAMWWMQKAMVRCHAQLAEWNREARRLGQPESYIIAQVHDELLFDFPRRADPRKNPKCSNLGRMRIIQRLMQQGGDDIGIPTPVSLSYIPDNWSGGVKV